MNNNLLKLQIEEAILSTLVVENKKSIYLAVDKIIKIKEQHAEKLAEALAYIRNIDCSERVFNIAESALSEY